MEKVLDSAQPISNPRPIETQPSPEKTHLGEVALKKMGEIAILVARGSLIGLDYIGEIASQGAKYTAKKTGEGLKYSYAKVNKIWENIPPDNQAQLALLNPAMWLLEPLIFNRNRKKEIAARLKLMEQSGLRTWDEHIRKTSEQKNQSEKNTEGK
jgi:hypothetical protein